MIPGYKKLDSELRFAYYCGAKSMWQALCFASAIEGMTLDGALGKMARWLDGALLPWGRDAVEITGIKYCEGYPIPPGVERLPDVNKDV